MNDLLNDPVGAVKWLVVFMALAAIYMQLRVYERRLSGKADEVSVKAPLRVVTEHEQVTHLELDPVVHRVVNLENEVRVIRLKMDADKNEILAAGDARASEINRRLDDLAKSTGEGFRGVDRALGRLEGKS